MPYPNEHACRINDPDKYERIARKNCDMKVDDKCVDVIYGIKAEGGSEIQALRYPKDVWREEAARAHCKERDGTFEPASEEPATAARRIARPWYALEERNEEAEISIFDEIGGWWGVSVKQFKKDFDSVRNKAEIRLILNSPGGNVFDGMAVYNILSKVRRKLTVEVIGLAASSASIVALAGRKLVMGEGAYFMIHNPWGFALGDAEEMLRTAELLEKLRGELANIYTAHSSLSRDQILERMREETWYTAAEAVEAGFASTVVQHGEVAACAFDLSGYKYAHVPETIREFVAATVARGPTELITEIKNTSAAGTACRAEEGKMTHEEIKAAIAELTDEERTGLIDELGLTASDQVGTLEGRINALEKANEQLSAQLAEANQREAQKRKAEAIEGALQDGRIPPVDREFWEQRFDQDPVGTEAVLAKLQPSAQFREIGTGNGGEGADALGSEERELLARMGYSEQQLIGR
jgi:ATP-dependent Clp endopeptidase proteolytic subunit ClpP